MIRGQWFLVMVLTLSALALVNARYHERRLYGQMERVDRSNQKLASDIEALQVELTALRNPARIDVAARRDLKMVPIRPNETLYFVIPKASAANGGTP
jgi:cell division protein FtsL